jgi:hypothetical protein
MPLKINEYREYVLKRKFTQNPSFYTMTIPGGGIKNDNTLKCYPDSITVPGRTFISTDFSYSGPEFSFPLRREYNQLSVNFIVYQDWKERQFFENWMDSIIKYKKSSFDTGLVSDIIPSNLQNAMRTIFIDFNKREKGGATQNLSMKFVDSYPSTITPAIFSSDNSSYTVFTVLFSYKFYDITSQKVDLPTENL